MHDSGRRNVETRTSFLHSNTTKIEKIQISQKIVIGSIDKVLSSPLLEPKSQNQHSSLAFITVITGQKKERN